MEKVQYEVPLEGVWTKYDKSYLLCWGVFPYFLFTPFVYGYANGNTEGLVPALFFLLITVWTLGATFWWLSELHQRVRLDPRRKMFLTKEGYLEFAKEHPFDRGYHH